MLRSIQTEGIAEIIRGEHRLYLYSTIILVL